MIRGTVEEALNAMVDAEGGRLYGTDRYERSKGPQDTRAGSLCNAWCTCETQHMQPLAPQWARLSVGFPAYGCSSTLLCFFYFIASLGLTF